MTKSAANLHLRPQEEEDDDAYDDFVPRNDSPSFSKAETGRGQCRESEQKSNSHRSKHSETEQRRRSKINERFQTLRDLIPQTDQKRDKASFLLEVIEYIQFLQEKLQMYEGSYQGWNNEPAKLIPWKSQHVHAESLVEHPHVIRSGLGFENDVASPALFTNVQHSIEPNMATAAPLIFHSMNTQTNMFATNGNSSMSRQHVNESASVVENMAYHSQFTSWQSRDVHAAETPLPKATRNEQEDVMVQGESASLSSVFSQGILNNLRHSLQSSGVDLSQANISVQVDVCRRENNGNSSMPSCTKDNGSQYVSNPDESQTEVMCHGEDCEQASKRPKTGIR